MGRKQEYLWVVEEYDPADGDIEVTTAYDAAVDAARDLGQPVATNGRMKTVALMVEEFHPDTGYLEERDYLYIGSAEWDSSAPAKYKAEWEAASGIHSCNLCDDVYGIEDRARVCGPCRERDDLVSMRCLECNDKLGCVAVTGNPAVGNTMCCECHSNYISEVAR